MQLLYARILVFVIGVLVGLGGTAGILFLLQENSTSSTLVRFETSQKVMSLPPANTVNNDKTGESPDVAVYPSNLENLVFPKRTFNRKAGVVFWVATLTDDQVVSFLQQSTDRNWNTPLENRSELQTTLLQKLSTTTPVRALDFALERDSQQRYSMIITVFETWAKNDLNGAIEHAKELNEQDLNYAVTAILDTHADLDIAKILEIATEIGNKQLAFASYFGNLTKNSLANPRKKWYEILDLANRENVQTEASHALNRIAIIWFEQRGLQVLDEVVSSLSDDYEYSSVLYQMFNNLSPDQSERAFDYVINNLGDRATEVIQSSGLAYNWVSKDPKGMLAKVKSLPGSRFQQNLLRLAVQSWAKQNPRQILEQLELLPPSQREYASRQAITEFTRSSPNAATQFVLRVSDQDLKRQLARTLVQQWTEEDARAAKEWVLSLPANEPIRTSLIFTLTWSLIEPDPIGAFELALQQTNEKGLEVSILDRIAGHDVQLALELLPQVSESNRVSAYTAIGSALIEQGDALQALNLANDLNATEQNQFHQGVAMAWFYVDPNGFQKAFDDFPNSIKSKVAVAIDVANEVTKSYSDDEISNFKKHISEKDQELLKHVREIDMNDLSREDWEVLELLHLW